MQVFSIVNPEDENLDQGEVIADQEQALESSTEDLEVKQPTVEELIAAKEVEWKAQADALQARLQQYQPLLEQAQQAEQDRRSATLEAVISKVVETSDNSESPLDDKDITALRTLIRKGAEFDTWSPWIAQNQIAASALIYAGAHLGRDATVGELQDLAKELADYQDPRLMQARISMLKNARANNQAESRRTFAATRQATGVDRVTPAPTQTADASDFNILERKVAEKMATPAEWSRYEKLYAARRRG